MTITIADYKSGKTEGDENFPVASRLIASRFRGPILAYYRFARAADDAADHPSLSEREKYALLDALEDTLLGKTDAAADALPLRRTLAEVRLSPRHALDLLTAFRQDVGKRRYRDWGELMHYCRYSAMPVGRFVLDVHGEDPSTWRASDALCTALQVINHLQDCAADYRALDRVYVPLDSLAVHGLGVEALAAPRASPQLRACLKSLATRTAELMPEAANLPRVVKNLRLSLETAAIVKLAHKLIKVLLARDPLSERVHLSRETALRVAAQGAAGAIADRISRQLKPFPAARGDVQ
jgi:squalene synthase HpnC